VLVPTAFAEAVEETIHRAGILMLSADAYAVVEEVNEPVELRRVMAEVNEAHLPIGEAAIANHTT